MDPYLENPARWRGFHSFFIVQLAGELNSVLPQTYVAVVEERVYVLPPARSIYPDAMIVKDRETAGSRVRASTLTRDRVADMPEIVSVWPDTVRERYVEIRAVGEPETVVAVIELLSPSNKAANSLGRREYWQKQEEVLQSQIHLLEIDLLRTGEHTVAVPKESIEMYGTWDYLISLHDANRPQDFSFWRCSLRDNLPCVAIPLHGEFTDAIVDLQYVLNETFDRGRYEQRIDYREDPMPPLKSEDAQWADALLREAGLRNT